MSATKRAPVEEYYPEWLDAADVEFDYCFATCGCGWATEKKDHPDQARYELDLHGDYGRSPDCTLGKIKLQFADGSEVTIQ